MGSPLVQHGIIVASAEDEERLLSISSARVFPSTWNVAESVNLRDLGTAGDQHVLCERVYRSSQVVCTQQLRELGIKTVIDLRQAPVSCKAQGHNVRQAISSGISECFGCCPATAAKDGSTSRLPLPNPCWRCTEDCDGHYGCQATVYHVDLLPRLVTLFIFSELPGWLQAKVLVCTVKKRNAEPLVAAAVADPSIMGYFKLYRIILHRASRQIVQALKLFADEANYPILVHCIHGKDRTGLIVMLLYFVCEVPEDVIIRDYAQSESLLREGRENRKLLGIEEHMTTDEIMSSAAHVMKATIEYIVHRYGSVVRYLTQAGLTVAEMERIRRNMTVGRDLTKAQLDERLNGV